MKTETKHYMEIFWARKMDKKIHFDLSYLPGNETINQVLERDPLLLDSAANRNIIKGFRFFDVTEETLENGEKKAGERENWSPMFYYGKRLTLEESDNLDPFWVKLMMEKRVKSIIVCDCECIITNLQEGDMTIEEYRNRKENDCPQKIHLKR